jgi:hypothetical protein
MSTRCRYRNPYHVLRSVLILSAKHELNPQVFQRVTVCLGLRHSGV